MKKVDVVTIGGAVRDITFYTDAVKIVSTPQNLTSQRLLTVEYGTKVYPTESYFNLGGGAANSAIAFARLGFKTTAVVRLGKDEDAHDIFCRFQAEGIDTDFLQYDSRNHTGISFIISRSKKDRDYTAFVNRGANNHLALPKDLSKQLAGRWVYLTSLGGPNWPQALTQVFNYSQTTGAKIAWNPGQMQIQAGKKKLEKFLAQTDVLILNKDEAIELVLSGVRTGRQNPTHLNRPVYLLNILKEWGPKIVIITGGRKGAWAFDGKQIIFQKGRHVKTVDTTGVGDAFGSTVVVGLTLTKDLKRALRWAAVNAASVCTHVGAQHGLLTINDLKKVQ